MSDLLNEAVKRWDGWQYGDTLRDMGTMDIILEAARRYANPNYKAGWHWAIRRQAMSLEFATGIINAALGITDTDE